MNEKKYILFIDSGIGGVAILDSFLKINPDLNIIYFADTAFFPYGNKSEEFLQRRLLDIYKKMIETYHIGAMVLACNSATVSTVEFLNENLDIPIVGTMPPIQKACTVTKNNRIGVIATQRTVESRSLEKMIKEYDQSKDVFVHAAPQLAVAVEQNYDDTMLNEVFHDELRKFFKYDIDVLVLGCTHYFYLADEIKNYFYNKVAVVDPREDVANKLNACVDDTFYDAKSEKVLYLSNSSEDILECYQKFNERFGCFDRIV